MYKDTIEIPKALRYLILANNSILKKYQEELMDQVYTAALEHMELLKLNPKEGWRFDVENMLFVQIEPPTDTNKEDASVTG